MRVRLINPFVADLRRLDTVATKGSTLGYDDEFGETRLAIRNGKRVEARTEKAPLRVRCQIEDDTMTALRQYDAGNSPDAKLGIVIDYADLRKQSLILGDTGEPAINVNDRLEAIYDVDGCLVQKIRTPPGLYAIEVRPMSFGIGRRLNLLLVLFSDRAVSQKMP